MDKLLGVLGNFNSKKLGIAGGSIAAISVIPVPEPWGPLVKVAVIAAIAIAHLFAQSGVDKKAVEKGIYKQP